MTSKLSWLALGVGVYLALVIRGFPASVAYRWFAPPELKLAAIEGTVWNGTAAYGAFDTLSLSDLRWQLSPWALLTARLSVSAEGRLVDGFAVTRLTASRNRLRLTDLRASMSLASLKSLLDLGGTEGQVSAELQSLELVDGWPVNAAGEVTVAELSVVPILPADAEQPIALGDYHARFTPGEEPGIFGVVDDRGGPLELAGRISLTPDRNYRIEALIKPRADAPEELVQGLDFMTGPANAEGQKPFELAGSL